MCSTPGFRDELGSVEGAVQVPEKRRLDARGEDMVLYISWARHVPRSRHFARELGAKDVYVEYAKDAPAWLLPVRYLIQSLRTWQLLARYRPRLVIVMNPPFVAPLIVYLYARLASISYVIDSGHTSAFKDRWARFFFVQRWLARRALTTWASNPYLADIVRSWGAPCEVMPDRIPRLGSGLNAVRNEMEAFKVAVVFSFNYNEPLDIVLQVAAALPRVAFGVTGDLRKIDPAYVQAKPDNLIFTDYLREDDYVRFVAGCDAVMVLTTTDHELPCAAYEAVAMERPMIISAWPTIREYFSAGAVYTDHTVARLVDAVKTCIRDHAQLSADIRSLKTRLDQDTAARLRDAAEKLDRAIASAAGNGKGSDAT